MALADDLKAAIRTIPDYPKPGILFRDITTLLGNARAFRRAVDALVNPWAGKKIDMQLVDLISGKAIGISQTLGSGAAACKLDASGLAEAAQAVTRAVQSEVELVIINKFSKQEAGGHGLRGEFAEAIMAGRPLLTAVPLSPAGLGIVELGVVGVMVAAYGVPLTEATTIAPGAESEFQLVLPDPV